MKARKGVSFNAIPLPKPGTTIARCCSVIDMGTIEKFYNNESQGLKPYIYITWELPKLLAVFNEDRGAEPFVIGLELLLSTNPKSNFAKLISAWRGKPLTVKEEEEFDPSVMLGKKALINFTVARKSAYKGKEVEKVTNENSVLKFNSIVQAPVDIAFPNAINELFIWDWELITEGKESFDEEKFNKIPKFIQKKMISSEEFRKYGRFTSSESAYETDEDDSNTQEEDTEVTEGGW